MNSATTEYPTFVFTDRKNSGSSYSVVLYVASRSEIVFPYFDRSCCCHGSWWMNRSEGGGAFEVLGELFSN